MSQQSPSVIRPASKSRTPFSLFLTRLDITRTFVDLSSACQDFSFSTNKDLWILRQHPKTSSVPDVIVSGRGV